MVLPEELARVARGRHPHPHDILGPHPEGDGFVVRCLRPGAASLVLIVGDTRVPARRIHEGGIFEARLAAHPGPGYRIEATYPGPRVETSHDPYAFRTPTVGELDLHLFGEGTHHEIYRHLGAHPRTIEGVAGTAFAVWAPRALSVAVIGDFNAWDGQLSAMRRLDGGVWEIFLPGVSAGALYKLEINSSRSVLHKSDPFGQSMQLRPDTASRVVAESSFEWTDASWLAERARQKPTTRPTTIYEVHLGSWRKKQRLAAPGEPPLPPEVSKRWLTYRELGDELVAHVAGLGFTHVELLPVMEHPYDGSWGYQVSGYFAPTARFGDPDDLRYLVDRFHAAGIGVILDWVPAHFPKDAAALGRFDGEPLFEHADPRRAEHHHWETLIFDYGKNEVKNFLVGSALYWFDAFHVDGLRVDAVASMLHLDYSARHDGDWLPNEHGGNENLDAVAFLRQLTTEVHSRFPGSLVAAEESTTWPGVTRPTYAGGLGFDFKWNMGWMHDTLDYFALDSVFRAYQHRMITFGLMYAYTERFILPLSHDEVVHLKKSLYGKMSGDPWRKRAGLRALFAYMFAQPGKKLLFMGSELGQKNEWSFEGELEWNLLHDEGHAGIGRFVRELNRFYRTTPALYELDDEPAGFRWIDANDASQSVASFIRFPESKLERRRTGKHVVFVGNFTPLPRHGYRIGVPRASAYLEVLNSDASEYGGSNMGNLGRVDFEDVPSHGYEQSVVLTLPPLAALYLVPEQDDEPDAAEIARERAEIDEERRVAAEVARKGADPSPRDAATTDPAHDPTEGAFEKPSSRRES